MNQLYVPALDAAPREGALRDARGRHKRKLRVSLTDRCNLQCLYCMPEHPKWLPREQILRRDELVRLVRLFVTELGIREVRLTGGEPLLRRDAVEIVGALNDLRSIGLERIAMTSNAVRLAPVAGALRQAGLDDLNISIDSITPERFHAMTRGQVAPVLEGIAAARAAGIGVKLNSVVIRGYNEDEVLPLVRWAAGQDVSLRFIEFMPLDGRGLWTRDKVITEAEILEQVGREFGIERLPRTAEPAEYFRLDGRYRLGIIPTISRPFCSTCDRVRLSATGELYSCLFSEACRDLKAPLRSGADDARLAQLVRGHVWHKEAGYAARPGYVERPITMHHLGG
ncbi:MAG: molybdenum cofactor biosynthesis protein MoaA [Panacagrimonas sp.]|nr:GTP 3',8-cyclase MoaA [Panacagrimonas sp.]MCC2656771.1 molybdenum cofactor biosynthesis protein MoaA [Panacagrimonas sp.]